MLDREPLTSTEVADRVREAIVSSGIQQNLIAERVGVTPQALTGWLKTGAIKTTNLGKLAAVVRRPAEFFIYRDWQDSEWGDILGFPQQVGLGDGVEAQEYAETHKLKFRADSLARQRLRPHALAVMYGKGDSMLPRIHNGDAILFDTSDTRPQHKKIFVIYAHGIAGDEYNAKRCLILDDTVYFEALNPDADHSWNTPIRMDSKRNPIKIVGRVRWLGSWEK